MKRKIAGLLLAALLCIGSAVYLAEPAAAAKSSADFEDLKDLDLETKAKFDALIEAGIFDGVEEGKFGVNDKMNRAQFAKAAALVFNLDVKDNAASSFDDVTADDPANGYAVPYIEAIKQAGITDGYGEGIFNPAGEVTKEQLAAFLVRGLGWEKDAQATPGVSDDSVSDWAKSYVALAIEKKILASGEDGTFDGNGAASRAELVTSSYGAAEIIVEEYNNYLEKQAGPDNQDEDDAEPPRKPIDKLIESVTKAQEQIEIITKEKEKAKEQEENEQQEAAAPITPYVPYIPPAPSAAAAPSAQPASGTVVASGTQVALTSATDSATIYYTTDLSQPTASSTQYTGPITITGDTTIKAIAVKSGYSNSSIAAFEYTVTAPIVLPDAISSMTEGQAYNGTVAKQSGGTGDVTYAVTDGALPQGLALDLNTGAITGTPSVSGAYSFTITATDSTTPPTTASKAYTGTITPVTKTPLELINEAAESGDWNGIDETTFTEAGITGVTPGNVAAIIAALKSDGAAPWTITEIEYITAAAIVEIEKQAALDLINEAADSGDWAGIDETTLTNAGVTGVTADNAAAIIAALEADGAAPWTLADVQSIVNTVIADLEKQAAVDLINTAASSRDWTGVTVETFAKAGITGITEVNLYGYQGMLQNVYYYNPGTRTAAEIQAILDELTYVDALLTYFANPYGSRPTLETFARAGITGVNASNIDDIIEGLVVE